MDSPTVLYIAGYGRSGSTLLSVLLGAHDRAVCVGELTYLGQEWKHDGRVCACGTAYDQCSFWAGAIQEGESASELTQLTRQVEHRSVLPRLLAGALTGRQRQAYRHRMRRLFTYAADRGEAEWVVDSSKSARHAAGRFWALRKVAGLDVHVIHLVRDGRDVLRSVVEKGTNWAAEGYREESALRAERTVIGWDLANILAWSLGRALNDDRYLRVHFEDLLEDPESVFSEIGAFIGEDLSAIADHVAANRLFSVQHIVAGNRVRHKQHIRLRHTAKDQRHPWSGLDTYHRALFALSGQWLNFALGYN